MEFYEGHCKICQDWQYGQAVKTNKNLDTSSSVYIATDGAIRKVQGFPCCAECRMQNEI